MRLLLIFTHRLHQSLCNTYTAITYHTHPYYAHTIKSNVTRVLISFSSGIPSHIQALVSSHPFTLTESALSSPRAAEPGAAALSRSARARSFLQPISFHAALFPFGISRLCGCEAGETEREYSRCFPPPISEEPPVRVSSVD